MIDHANLSETPSTLPELSNAFLAQALFSLPEPIGVKDRHFRWVFLNEAGCRALGLDAREVLGKTDYELFPADQARMFAEDDQRALAGELVQRDEAATYRGEDHILAAAKIRVYDPETREPYILVSVCDVTARVSQQQQTSDDLEEEIAGHGRALQALQESERAMRSLFENAPDAIFIEDLSGTVLDVNPVACALHGQAREELIGQNVLDLVPPEQREAVQAKFGDWATGELSGYSGYSLREDGTRVPVDIRASRITHRGQPALLFHVRDVSHERNAQLERDALEQQMQQAQRLESLGVLSGGIAHDFNNILMAILGNAELTLTDEALTSSSRQCISEIVGAARRAAELCRQMSAYSGHVGFSFEYLDLNDILDGMSELLVCPISRGIVLNRQLADSLPRTRADASQLRQVVLNLVTNAAEAIGSKTGVISVATGACDCSADDLRTFLMGESAEEGTYVYLEVSDTGSGIAQESVSRIFDPFYTTRFVGRGLGLAAVLGIVRGHKGMISVYSKQGEGTTIRVMFRAADGAAEQPAPSSPSPSSGTVLLADDEETVRVVASRMLKTMGFEAVCVADGREAVQVFKEQGDRIACVMLDLTMPHMDGAAAMGAIREIRPDVPVILCSGYDEHELSERFRGKGVSGFLHKPYGTRDLADKLTALFGGVVGGE